MQQGLTFRAFVRTFLPAYDTSKLSAMRNRLVHNYVVPPDAYAFSAGRERAAEHLAPANRERIILELLADDVERAGAELLMRAARQPKLRKRLLARVRTPGLLLAEPSDVA